jgi:hypothetical protein
LVQCFENLNNLKNHESLGLVAGCSTKAISLTLKLD